ncbi:hypothetical protein RHMOL_Rhmol05G0162100 [Rhododendron molle]|uniref:Uncharacterized protein n=1 Tax=Rhododendron molle TaxID=49168 RepID=A0ACC0NQK3_RHOML|nr:hypothetical protein RHMOL_Rhmol05G0162100 [Rhododendron molle]
MILKQYRENRQFLIGSKLVELRVSDIHLIFAIISGKKKVSGLYCSRNKVKFVRRKDLQILDRQGIKNLITEQLLKSNKKKDVQDVARLVCLFLCATLFFTSSATLSWVYVKHMDDWNKMKNYDWGTTIKDMLIKSIEKNISDPWKVQGCAILLFVNEDELTRTSEEDFIYKMQIEQKEGQEGGEEREEEENEDEEEEEEQEEEEEEQEQEEEIIDQQHEIEQEVIHIEEEEDEEEQVGEEKEKQVKEKKEEEKERDATPLEQVVEEGQVQGIEQEEEQNEGDLVEEGEQEEEEVEKKEEEQGDATPLEQVAEE